MHPPDLWGEHLPDLTTPGTMSASTAGGGSGEIRTAPPARLVTEFKALEVSS